MAEMAPIINSDLKPERIDTYKSWQAEQKIPVVRGFFVKDINTLELEYWDLKGVPCSMVVLDGTGWGGVTGEAPLRLGPGDVLVFPHGDPYAMSIARDLRGGPAEDEVLGFLRAMAAGQLPFSVTEGGGGSERGQPPAFAEVENHRAHDQRGDPQPARDLAGGHRLRFSSHVPQILAGKTSGKTSSKLLDGSP